jgi:hypothetical protein
MNLERHLQNVGLMSEHGCFTTLGIYIQSQMQQIQKYADTSTTANDDWNNQKTAVVPHKDFNTKQNLKL